MSRSSNFADSRFARWRKLRTTVLRRSSVRSSIWSPTTFNNEDIALFNLCIVFTIFPTLTEIQVVSKRLIIDHLVECGPQRVIWKQQFFSQILPCPPIHNITGSHRFNTRTAFETAPLRVVLFPVARPLWKHVFDADTKTRSPASLILCILVTDYHETRMGVVTSSKRKCAA